MKKRTFFISAQRELKLACASTQSEQNLRCPHEVSLHFVAVQNAPSEDSDKAVYVVDVQSTLVISNSKGLSEILRDIRTSTYQTCRI